MEYDSFLSSQRWAILEILARMPSSPIQIAAEIGTSVSYVSQQLKLLEAAEIVEKEKTGEVQKGKPRNLFRLKRELLHLTALTNGWPAKKTLYLNSHHKSILNIWLTDNLDLHEALEKFYWSIKNDLGESDAIYIDTSVKKPRVIVVSDSKMKKVSDFGKDVEVEIVSSEAAKKISREKLHPIYDPKNLLLEKNLKGGEK